MAQKIRNKSITYIEAKYKDIPNVFGGTTMNGNCKEIAEGVKDEYGI